MFLKTQMTTHNILIMILVCTWASVMMVNAFNGDGTFYGDGGHGAEGACMLERGFNGIPMTVAINHEQWMGGAVCGRCVLIQPTLNGIGMTPIAEPLKATIDNLCPECNYGDIDIGLDGDGRWKILWEFVEC